MVFKQLEPPQLIHPQMMFSTLLTRLIMQDPAHGSQSRMFIRVEVIPVPVKRN